VAWTKRHGAQSFAAEANASLSARNSCVRGNCR
jgi:hypothetical protein